MRDTAQQQVARGDVRRQATAVAQQQQRLVDEENACKRQATSDSAADGANGGRSAARAATGSSSRRKDSAPPAANTATAAGSITTKSQSKMLLRELCVDKDYLEHLTVDPSNISLYLNARYFSYAFPYTICIWLSQYSFIVANWFRYRTRTKYWTRLAIFISIKM